MGCSSCGGNISSQVIKSATSRPEQKVVVNSKLQSLSTRPSGTYAAVRKKII